MKIRHKDQAIYDKDAKFYSSEEEDEDGNQENGDNKAKKNKEKPMYLKDVVFKEAMERAAGEGSDSDSEYSRRKRNINNNNDDDDDEPKVKTYTQEQQDLKSAFLDAFNTVEVGADDDGGDRAETFGGVLKARRKVSSSDRNEGTHGEDDNDDSRVQKLLDSYFGGEGGDSNGAALNAEDRFLRNYILNKGWVEDGDDGRMPSDNEDGNVDEDYEDEEAIAAAEAFEANYNFRFEEPGGGQLVTHPRQMEGAIRKEDDRRKRKRAEKAARKEAEEEERRAEIRRLKNIKKSEIHGRLAEVEIVAGKGAPPQDLLDRLLGGDFDPEEHDRAMAAAFGDDYYGLEDEDDIADAEFEKELADMAEYPSDEDDKEAHQGGAVDDDEQKYKTVAAVGEDEDEGEDGGEGAAAARADVKRLLEEYHRLDYEDHVGGIPTRFRYKEVAPESYGLTIEEILSMDDKELNQVMGLKRVAAPYGQGQQRVRPNYGTLNALRRERGAKQHERFSKQQDGGNKKMKKRYDHQQPPPPEPNKPTAAEKRLATYSTPKLKKRPAYDKYGDQAHAGGGGGEKKKKEGKHVSVDHEKQRQNAAPQHGLSKTQRKNMKRAAKRATKRADD